MLGHYVQVGNSLESTYFYLERSDDGGATWSRVWTGPDTGSLGYDQRAGRGPDVTGALAVGEHGEVALAAVDGSILVSADGGHTFVAHPTPSRDGLIRLWLESAGPALRARTRR